MHIISTSFAKSQNVNIFSNFFLPCTQRRSTGDVLVVSGDRFQWHLEGKGIQTGVTNQKVH